MSATKSLASGVLAPKSRADTRHPFQGRGHVPSCRSRPTAQPMVRPEACLEGGNNVRHPLPVPLQTVRRRLNLWLQRPFGRLASLLLLVAMVSAGVPTAQVHAHTGGDHDHDHHAQLSSGGAVDQHDHTTPADPDGDTALHAHDACTTVSALSSVPMMVPSGVGPVAPSVRAAGSPPPLAPRIPPYRPPIA